MDDSHESKPRGTWPELTQKSPVLKWRCCLHRLSLTGSGVTAQIQVFLEKLHPPKMLMSKGSCKNRVGKHAAVVTLGKQRTHCSLGPSQLTVDTRTVTHKDPVLFPHDKMVLWTM